MKPKLRYIPGPDQEPREIHHPDIVDLTKEANAPSIYLDDILYQSVFKEEGASDESEAPKE